MAAHGLTTAFVLPRADSPEPSAPLSVLVSLLSFDCLFVLLRIRVMSCQITEREHALSPLSTSAISRE